MKKPLDKGVFLWYNVYVRNEREDNKMLQKNIDKEKRKERKLWTGLYTRKTPTKREKLEKNSKKYKKPLDKYD